MKTKDLNLLGVMTYLSDLSYEKIIIKYSGGGDSGAIDEIYFVKFGESEEESFTSQDKKIINPDVRDYIESLCFRQLDRVEDWWNNEGGYGSMDLHIPSGEFVIHNNIFIQNEEYYKTTGKLDEEEIN